MQYGRLAASARTQEGERTVLVRIPEDGFDPADQRVASAKNSASLIGPGIDVRGDGGMVVGPPSVKLGKGVYSWRNDLPIADAPRWLLDRIVAGKVRPMKAAFAQVRRRTRA